MPRTVAAAGRRGGHGSAIGGPPYSPDLNPIEKRWSKVKAWLRRVAAQTYDALIESIADALRSVDPTECAHYFASCGYGDYL